MCVCEYVFSSIQFYHMCRLQYLPLQLRYRPFLSPQSFVPSCNDASLSSIPHLQSLIPNDHESAVISKVLSFPKCKWEHVVCNWLFSLMPMPWRFTQISVCINSFFFLLLSSILWYGCPTECSSIHPMKETKVASSVGLLQIKLQ